MTLRYGIGDNQRNETVSILFLDSSYMACCNFLRKSVPKDAGMKQISTTKSNSAKKKRSAKRSATAVVTKAKKR